MLDDNNSGQPQRGTGPGGGKFPTNKIKYYIVGAIVFALLIAVAVSG